MNRVGVLFLVASLTFSNAATAIEVSSRCKIGITAGVFLAISGLFFGLAGWSQVQNDQDNANFLAQFNDSNSAVVGYSVERTECKECVYCNQFYCRDCTIFNWQATTVNQFDAWSQNEALTLNATGPKGYCGISPADAVAGAPAIGSTVWLWYNISNPKQTTYWLYAPNNYIGQRNGLFGGGSVFAVFALVTAASFLCN